MKKIICSHGFGVARDDKGLFPRIQAAFQDYEFVMFDYNKVDEQGSITVRPLPEQVQILEQTLEQYSEPVVLLAHSQGCIVAALSNLKNVDKVIFLTPPASMSSERIVKSFSRRPGTIINLTGDSKLERSDGAITVVPKEYWQGLDVIEAPELFASVAKDRELTIVRATQDEVLGRTDLTVPQQARLIDIKADHNFTGTFAKDLNQLLADLL